MRRSSSLHSPWVEAFAGVAALVLALVTMVWRDWIEAVFGVDPDRGNGTVEWLVVGLLVALALVLGAHAKRGFALRRAGAVS